MLDFVDRVPRGRVVSYGDVCAAIEAGSPRAVGQVMHRFGGEVAWQRVVMHDGSPAPHKAREQLALLRAEGVALAADGHRVDMAVARWVPGGRRGAGAPFARAHSPPLHKLFAPHSCWRSFRAPE